MSKNRLREVGKRYGPGTVLAVGALLSALLGSQESYTFDSGKHRDTVVCGRGTYLEGLAFDDQGRISTEGATRISYLELPGEERVNLYDPGHQAGSLAHRGEQDRTDMADRNSDITFGLGAKFGLDFNNEDEVTKVQRLEPLSAEQVNAACGRVAMVVSNRGK